MPEVDINLKRNDPNARKDLVDFWREKNVYSNKNNTLIPFSMGESGSHQGIASEKDIIIPIGKDDKGYTLFDFNFGYNLIAGGSMLSGAGMFRRVSLEHLAKTYSYKKVKVILLDTINQMSDFDNIPHLLFPRATKVDDCINQLDWCLKETDKRLDLLKENNHISILSFNENKKDDEIISDIFIFISELGDIPDISYTTKIAQVSKGTSIHFLITTQQPSKDKFPDLIKSVFPHRIAFQMPYKEESELFIDQSGAEELLGQGDMLFKDGYNNKIIHLQGLYYKK